MNTVEQTPGNYRGSGTSLLDHGHLVLADYMGGDLSVVRAARVSYDAAWRAGENEANDDKLLRRLWSGGKAVLPQAPAHSTPFESVVLTFDVKAPIFVFRQWHRHRTQSYNELSLRYKEQPGDEFYVPEVRDIGLQSKDNKQGRDITESGVEFGLHYAKTEQRASYEAQCLKSFDTYHQLLDKGWPRELARCVLPLATYSHMQATANLRNWLAFCTLRCDPHAQMEIRVYAQAVVEMLTLVVPKTMALWTEANGGDAATV